MTPSTFEKKTLNFFFKKPSIYEKKGPQDQLRAFLFAYILGQNHILAKKNLVIKFIYIRMRVNDATYIPQLLISFT